MTHELRSIAVFDFDGTLIEGDSFFPFLAYVAGWPRTLLAFAQSLICLIGNYSTLHTIDARTFVKAQLIHRLLAGQPLNKLNLAAEKLRVWRRWNESMRQALLEHSSEGHLIVVASGGLDLYLPELLKDIPYQALICTEIGILNGVATDQMTQGNCVRARKAELVAEYMKNFGPFKDSWGYGNLPHDLPMLNLMKHRIII